MRAQLIALPGAQDLHARLARHTGLPTAPLHLRRFPDGEAHVSLPDDLMTTSSTVVLCADLRAPDAVMIPLALTAHAARALGAERVLLVAPYLPYMRQDAQFSPGECVAARAFAAMLQHHVDGLVTAAPHLHRCGDLSALFDIPTRCAAIAPAIARWARRTLDGPVAVIGPDEESAQWVHPLASALDAPAVVLDKVRRGDRDVTITTSDALRDLTRHTPLLLDDIISTGRTMLHAVTHLRDAGCPPPICIAVHGVFGDDPHGVTEALIRAGAERLVTTTSIPLPTSHIDLTPELADALASIL